MTPALEQKPKMTGPLDITANRLGDGAVVYRTRHDNWPTPLDGAAAQHGDSRNRT
jgi:hypothetical protein